MPFNPEWDTKTAPLKTVLNVAADLIEKHGHLKNSLGNKQKGFCIVGALAEAARESFPPVAAHYPEGYHCALGDAIDRIEKTLPKNKNGANYIVNWNNDEKRTATEVINKLRETADAI
jgi:hypothetical protein